MTPNDIEVLIHCHCKAERHPRAEAPAVLEAHDMFAKAGMIIKGDGNYYKTTGRGNAMINILCATPFPEMAWIDGNRNIIGL